MALASHSVFPSSHTSRFQKILDEIGQRGGTPDWTVDVVEELNEFRTELVISGTRGRHECRVIIHPLPEEA